jgi:hypothetical protein
MLLRALAFFNWESDASYRLRSGDIAGFGNINMMAAVGPEPDCAGLARSLPELGELRTTIPLPASMSWQCRKHRRIIP